MTMARVFRDPEKRAAKRRARREAEKRSVMLTPRKARPSQSQMTHASSGKDIKHRREGEKKMKPREPRTPAEWAEWGTWDGTDE